MRKKYLSALLFGALLFASAGTFTSCKDYDDDINNLQSQITANADAIKALQDLVNAGKYVSGVAMEGQTITFTFSDGSTQPITIPAGEKGQTVVVKDGELYIDDEATGIKVAEELDTEAGLVKSENGTWWVLNENGEYTNTNIPVSGITVSGSEKDGYTFTIYDEKGESQTVKLPSAVSSITEMTLGDETTQANTAYEYNGASIAVGTKSVLISNEKFDYTNLGKNIPGFTAGDWKGNKKLPADGDFIYSSPTKIDLRIDPVNVDATTIDFYLTNTKNADLSPVVLNASASQDSNNDPMNNTNGRAAVTGNGLWSLSMANQIVAKADHKDTWDAITKADNNFVYAVNANHGFRSKYELKVQRIDAEILSSLYITGVDVNNDNKDFTFGLNESKGTSVSEVDGVTFKTGKAYKVNAVESSALYDMYLTADDTDKDVYGLTFDQDNHTFTIGKNPDVSSIPAEFELIVYTVANDGTVNKSTVTISINTEINNAAEYDLHEHGVNKTYNSNYFSIDLSTMKTALGDNLNQWLQNVDLGITVFEWSANGGNSYAPLSNVKGITTNIVSKVLAKNDGNYPATADRNNANFIQVDVDNSKVSGLDLDKTYYLKVTFKRSANEILNTIVVPVEFHAPALAELFTVKEGYLQEGVINAYFYKAKGATIDGVTYTNNATSVDLDRFFSASVSDATIAFSDNNVGETGKKGDDLFTLGANVFGSASSHTTLDFDGTNKGYYTLNGKQKPANGYGEAVTIVVNKSFYNNIAGTTAGWNYTQTGDDEYSFKIRLMSPIYEGEVRPVEGNSIIISGNEWVSGASITGDMIMGYDYNNNKYSAVPDAVPTTGSTTPDASWYLNPQIESVIPSQDKDKYIANVVVTPAEVDKKDATGKTIIPGEFKVYGTSLSNTQTVDMPVTVKDAWGYELEDSVPVTVQFND